MSSCSKEKLPKQKFANTIFFSFIQNTLSEMQIIVTQQGTHEVDVKCLNVFASTLIWNPFDFS